LFQKWKGSHYDWGIETEREVHGPKGVGTALIPRGLAELITNGLFSKSLGRTIEDL
jgi:hypothetical protein